ncbi:ChaN family lipoprotein [uncultured Piscinibacter sp.]|mgnify:CR=1 FL=1|uniref:ChaN family lipoprotein n=1 Tax=uncultured Piscinibacter sp. TaxID=1131835 RepID=UPI0026278B5E|nr:ChaN family lipoprotein [uncultured Piscinibacter sp.]
MKSHLLPFAALLLLAACVAPPPPLPDAEVLIFGEQHDQPDHQRQTARTVTRLAAEGRLAALVIEMAEQGRSTAGLPRDADAAGVRGALAWSGWTWSVYEEVVMAAVRAGVPVLGGNLPRSRLRDTMGDASREALVDAPVRAKLAAAVREGHCDLLPPAQEPGMVRIQIARDQAMAETVAGAVRPGQRVVLLTGAQHASRDRGVPLHLALRHGAPRVHVVIFGPESHGLAADELRAARLTPRPDPCEGLAERLRHPPGRS